MSTLTQLSYAVAVDEHRNFGRAAAACFVTQPTLSTQLAKLEDELEIVLFDRSRKPVVPTPEGALLLAQFRAVLREHARIDEVVDGIRGRVAGSFRLGIIPTMAPTMLPRIVPGFVRDHPEVQLQIEELTTDEIVRRLAEESLDGGILATPLSDPRLTEIPICDEPFVVFHAPQLQPPVDEDGRVRLDALPREHLIVMREGHCLRTQTLDLCALGEAATEVQRFEIEAGSLATLTAMVHEGPFFTVLPALSAAEMRERGRGDLVKEIAGEVPYREVAFVTRRLENRRAIREALIAHTRGALSDVVVAPRGGDGRRISPR